MSALSLKNNQSFIQAVIQAPSDIVIAHHQRLNEKKVNIRLPSGSTKLADGFEFPMPCRLTAWHYASASAEIAYCGPQINRLAIYEDYDEPAVMLDANLLFAYYNARTVSDAIARFDDKILDYHIQDDVFSTSHLVPIAFRFEKTSETIRWVWRCQKLLLTNQSPLSVSFADNQVNVTLQLSLASHQLTITIGNDVLEGSDIRLNKVAAKMLSILIDFLRDTYRNKPMFQAMLDLLFYELAGVVFAGEVTLDRYHLGYYNNVCVEGLKSAEKFSGESFVRYLPAYHFYQNNPVFVQIALPLTTKYMVATLPVPLEQQCMSMLLDAKQYLSQGDTKNAYLSYFGGYDLPAQVKKHIYGFEFPPALDDLAVIDAGVSRYKDKVANIYAWLASAYDANDYYDVNSAVASYIELMDCGMSYAYIKNLLTTNPDAVLHTLKYMDCVRRIKGMYQGGYPVFVPLDIKDPVAFHKRVCQSYERYQRLKRQFTTIYYRRELPPELPVFNKATITIRSLKNLFELIELGEKLDNCLGGYIERLFEYREDDSYDLFHYHKFFVVESAGEPLAAIMVQQDRICEAKINHNRPIYENPQLMAVVLEWQAEHQLSIVGTDFKSSPVVKENN